jgi:hypothetical protein
MHEEENPSWDLFCGKSPAPVTDGHVSEPMYPVTVALGGTSPGATDGTNPARHRGAGSMKTSAPMAFDFEL